MNLVAFGLGEALSVIVLIVFLVGSQEVPAGSPFRRVMMAIHVCMTLLALDFLFGNALQLPDRIRDGVGFANCLVYPIITVMLCISFPNRPRQIAQIILVPIAYVGFLVVTRPTEGPLLLRTDSIAAALGAEGSALPYVTGTLLGFVLVFWKQSGKSLAGVSQRLRQADAFGAPILITVFFVQTAVAFYMVAPGFEVGSLFSTLSWYLGVGIGSVHLAYNLMASADTEVKVVTFKPRATSSVKRPHEGESRVTASTLMASSHCGHCQTALDGDGGERPAVCDHCGAGYHRECLAKLGACVTPGCTWHKSAGQKDDCGVEPVPPDAELVERLRANLPAEGSDPTAVAELGCQVAQLDHPSQQYAPGRSELLLDLGRRKEMPSIAELATRLYLQTHRADVPKLLEVAEDPAFPFSHRHIAAHWAGAAGFSVLAELIAKTNYPSGMIQTAQHCLLTHIREPQAVQLLLRLYRRTDHMNQQILLERLGPMHAPFLPTVAALALESVPTVQTAAVRAAMRIDNHAALPMLRRLSDVGVGWVRREADVAAAALAGRSPSDPELCEAVKATVEAAPSRLTISPWENAGPSPRRVGLAKLVTCHLELFVQIGILLLTLGLVSVSANGLLQKGALWLLPAVGCFLLGFLSRGNLHLYRQGIYTRGTVEQFRKEVTHSGSGQDSRETVRYSYRLRYVLANGRTQKATWKNRITPGPSFTQVQGAEVGIVYDPRVPSLGEFAAELPVMFDPEGGVIDKWWVAALYLLPAVAMCVIVAMAFGILPVPEGLPIPW